MYSQEMIIQKLKDNSISPSLIRIKIYDYLSKDEIHPTVDEIYKNLIDSIPTISKTTVYNTLKIFVEKDLIRPINLYDNKMRYEFIRTNHAHLKCDICSKIYDIPVKIDINVPNGLKGSLINETNILLTGTCSNCLESMNLH